MNGSKHLFGNVQVLLADPDSPVLSTLKQHLISFGFTNTLTCGDLKSVREKLGAGGIDLLICSRNFPAGGLRNLVREIRHHEIGDNPFLCIIAMVSSPSLLDTKTALTAGVDSLIVTPAPPSLIHKHILKLINSRNSFVVTADYIGPDRRDEARQDKTKPSMMSVPNTLKEKSRGYFSSEEITRQIEQSIQNINDLKLGKFFTKVNQLSKRIERFYAENWDKDPIQEILMEFQEVMRGIHKCLEHSSHTHAQEITNALSVVTDSLIQNFQSPDPQDMQDFIRLSNAISSDFAVDDLVVERSRNIVMTLFDRFRATA